MIAEATVAEKVRRLREPVRIAGRAYTHGCRLGLDRVAPPREGLELAPLVQRLHAFPDPATWSIRMRRTLLAIDGHDVRLLNHGLESHVLPLREIVGLYQEAATAGKSRRGGAG